LNFVSLRRGQLLEGFREVKHGVELLGLVVCDRLVLGAGIGQAGDDWVAVVGVGLGAEPPRSLFAKRAAAVPVTLVVRFEVECEE